MSFSTPKQQPQDDTWAMGPIGMPFPSNPVKVLGQSNMYVGLWYKHGNPVHGRAWNDGGVLQCSFPYKKVELSGKSQLGGHIQVLQYSGDHNKLGFWYEWIQYKDRLNLSDRRQMLKCGESYPILWLDRPGGPLLGNLDNKIERGSFSHDGVTEILDGPKLNNMWIIVRNFQGGPPTCTCEKCMQERRSGTKKASSPTGGERPPPGMLDNEQWLDANEGDQWPSKKVIMALDKPLDTVPGEESEQYVALWFRKGRPIMGRAYRKDGKVYASFGDEGKEYNQKVGSMQMLTEMHDMVRDFDYCWVPYKDCSDPANGQYEPICASSDKKVAPCVLTIDGKQILGQADMEKKEASASFGGQQHVLNGSAVDPQLVLCRKLKDKKAAEEEARLQKEKEEAEAAEALKKKQEEEARLQKEKEEAEAAAALKKKQEEEEARLKKEKEEAEAAEAQKKREEEEARLRKQKEEAEAAEAAAAAAQAAAAEALKKQQEEEERLQKKKEEAEAAAAAAAAAVAEAEAAAALKKKQDEEARLQREKEEAEAAATRTKQQEEEARLRREKEEAEAAEALKRQQEEEAKLRKKKEEAEAAEAAAAAAQAAAAEILKKQQEEEARLQKKKEEAEAAAAAAAAAEAAAAAALKKQQEEEARLKSEKEEADAAAAQKKQQEEEARLQREKEDAEAAAARKQREEEEARLKKEKEEAEAAEAQKKREEEEARLQKKKEEAEAAAAAASAAQAAAAEALKKQQEEAEKLQKKREEVEAADLARKKKEAEEKLRREEEERLRRQREEETRARNAAQGGDGAFDTNQCLLMVLAVVIGFLVLLYVSKQTNDGKRVQYVVTR